MKYKQIMLQVIYVKKSQLVHFVQCFTAKSSSHDKIHKDDYDNEYIKFKSSCGLPDLEVYFDGFWKENGDKMVRFYDAGQSMNNLRFDSFADIESKSNCYYIDLTTSVTKSEISYSGDVLPYTHLR